MNKYQYQTDVGAGSFGVVSRATNMLTGELVAVKKMKRKYASWEECLQLRELTALRKLQHPNIVKLREAVRENLELFLVFEYMEDNLNSYLSGQRVSEEVARHLMFQVLTGLAYMHRNGMFHRDIKPENMLLKGDTVKLADFGLAKEIRSRPPFTEYVSTRWYRAPESLLHLKVYNSPVDIWGCGCVLAELLSGTPLFPGTNEVDTLFKVVQLLGSTQFVTWEAGSAALKRLGLRIPMSTGTGVRAVFPHVSSSCINFLESMLRVNPQERLTAQQLLSHPWFTNAADVDFIGLKSQQRYHPIRNTTSSINDATATGAPTAAAAPFSTAPPFVSKFTNAKKVSPETSPARAQNMTITPRERFMSLPLVQLCFPGGESTDRNAGITPRDRGSSLTPRDRMPSISPRKDSTPRASIIARPPGTHVHGMSDSLRSPYDCGTVSPSVAQALQFIPTAPSPRKSLPRLDAAVLSTASVAANSTTASNMPARAGLSPISSLLYSLNHKY